MIFLYNTLQVLLSPLFFIFIIFSKKRNENFLRLGIGFRCRPKQIGRKTFLIHADSVSEFTSSLLFLKGLKQNYPDAEIFFSTTNIHDERTASRIIGHFVDTFVLCPFDSRFTVNRFLRLIDPDLCLLINSTIQPNFCSCLQSKDIPSILVNFSVSAKRTKRYKRFPFFYKTFFNCITDICVQSKNDRHKLKQLGISSDRIQIPGNITFDTALYLDEGDKNKTSFILPEHTQLLIACFTHQGEEEIILQCVKKLKIEFPGIYLIIAPFNTKRGAAIHRMAQDFGFAANLRSQINVGGRDLFILDSEDMLFPACTMADIAFIGGSMVNRGGHNPVETATCGIPVLFGMHMENAFEISTNLIQSGGGILVKDQLELQSNIEALLRNPVWLRKKGAAAKEYCQSKQGVVVQYLPIIQKML